MQSALIRGSGIEQFPEGKREKLDPFIKIAIDGPTASGKTTIGTLLGERFGMRNTAGGVLYCAAGLLLKQVGLNAPIDEIEAAFNETPIDFDISKPGTPLVSIGGEDISDELASSEAKLLASRVSRNPLIVSGVEVIYHALATEGNIALEGKVVGTRLMPDADVKIFLTADPQVRAWRRWQQLLADGEDKTFAEVLHETLLRDKRDLSNPVAPLRPAPDAVRIDTTRQSIEETYALVENLILNQNPN